jgi:hypothetical protein
MLTHTHAHAHAHPPRQLPLAAPSAADFGFQSDWRAVSPRHNNRGAACAEKRRLLAQIAAAYAERRNHALLEPPSRAAVEGIASALDMEVSH